MASVTLPARTPVEAPLEVPRLSRNALKHYEAFLVPALMLFVLGHAAAYALPGWQELVLRLACPLALVLIGLIMATRRDGVIRGSMWLLVFLLGSLWYGVRHFEPGGHDVSRLAPRPETHVLAVVESTRPDRNQVVLSLSQLDDKPVRGQVLFQAPADLSGKLLPGDRLRITGELALPYENTVPGSFNQREYLRAQGIGTLLKNAQTVTWEPGAPLSPWHRLLRVTDVLRRHVAETFRAALPSPQAEILGGLVLGDRAVPVDANTRRAFVETGLVHVLAASGMNVGIIAGAVLWMLALLRVPRRLRLSLAIVAVAFYSMLTGLPPSIQRAASMLILALALKLVHKELSPLLLLCFAAAFLVTVNPDTIASIGFQFSVLTTFGLMTMLPPLLDRIEQPGWRRVAGMLLVPLVAQLWVWPLSLHYFNHLPLQSLWLNVLALFLITPLTVAGFTGALLSFLHPSLAEALCALSAPLLHTLLTLVHWGHGLTWAQYRLPAPAPWMVLLLYAQGLAWLWVLYRPFKARPALQHVLALAPLLALTAGLWWTQANHAQTIQVDIVPLSSQRTGYVLFPTQASPLALLPAQVTYWEGRRMADYLKHRNINRLSALVLLSEPGARPDVAGITVVRRQARSHHVLSSAKQPMRLTLPQLTVEARPRGVVIATPHHCLLAAGAPYPATRACQVQHLTQPAHRILLQGHPWTDDIPRRLTLDGHRLRQERLH